MKLELARPLCLLLLVFLVPMIIFTAKKIYAKATSRKVLQILVRSILYTCLVLALSGISIKWVSSRTTTIFLVDVSDSVRDQQSQVIQFVNDALKDKKSNDYVGVITFGEDAEVEQFVSQTVVFSEVQTDVNRTATDLESAISMAIGLMPEDSAKRIVLITDGNENEGSIKNTIASLAASNIQVEAMKLEENTSDEVYVSDISMPDSVGTGEKFNINVKIESNVATNAKVSLYLGRTLKGQQEVTLQKGTNNYIFTDTQSDEGLKTYRVIVEAENDTVSVNNEYSAYTDISTKQPILLVEGSRGEATELQGILDSIGVRYETYQPAAVPNTLSDLLEYSAVVFVDVYEDDLRNGFTDVLQQYIKDYGGGFIVTGGTNSYALGGYTDTPIEEVLPVNMRLNSKQEVPTMAFAMVIDHSGSMEDGNGYVTCLDLAKEAAIEALDNVRDTDYIGVLAFDDTYSWLVPMQLASDRTTIEDEISSLGIGGGTSIYPAFKEALLKVTATDAKVKHIILLTDGEDGYDYSNYAPLLEAAEKAGITVSTVAVGSAPNTSLLQSIADAGNGRMYVTDYNSDIPRIFAQEVYLSSESYLRNEEFTPILSASSELMNGVTDDGIPSLKGYVATTAKSNSITILKSEEDYPILSTWQYGLGKTIAWTSDFTGDWSGNWSGQEDTQRLWANMISYVTQQTGVEGAYAEIDQEGKTAVINYTTGDYSGKTTVIATITDDEGNSEDVELEPEKPGEYSCSFDMESTGVYSISIRQYEDGEVVGNLNTAAIMQYSLEYQFMNVTNDLESFISSVNGQLIETADQVFATPLERVRSRIDISTPMLIFAAFFLLFDIAVRRFHLDLLGRSKQKQALRAEKKAERRAAKQAAKAEKTAARAQATQAAAAAATQPQTAADPASAPQAARAGAKAARQAEKQAAKAKQAARKAEQKKTKELLDTSSLLNHIKRDE